MTAPLPRIMVAPTGARRGKADHPALPITTAEIVSTARACAAEGADGLHLHIRDADGLHTLDPDRYRCVVAAVETAVPQLYLQVTSEAAGRFAPAVQRDMIRALAPCRVSVALRELMATPPDQAAARDLYHWAPGAGVDLQHIVYTPQELDRLIACIDAGDIPGATHRVQLVVGRYDGSVPSHPDGLDPYLDRLEACAGRLTFDWMLCAFGAAETACLAYAASRGGKVRVGFENSLWNADGGLATDNAERVAEVAAELARLPVGA